jgi:hypothetical protein
MMMFRIIGVCLCFGLLSGCTTIYKVNYDYDQHVDFLSLKTYDWMPVPDNMQINSLAVERVRIATEAELRAKGVVKSTANPDFLVVQHVNAQEQINVTNWGYGYGPRLNYVGTSLGRYWGTGGVPTYGYEQGTLILDFVDPKTKQMIWRGAAAADVEYVDSSDKRWDIIKNAVKEILKNYPPPVK